MTPSPNDPMLLHAPLPDSAASDVPPVYRQRFWNSLQRPSGMRAAIVVGALALIGTCWLAVLAQARFERQDNIDDVMERNTNLAIAFEQFTTRTLRNADVIATYARREYLRSGARADLRKVLADSAVDHNFYSAVLIFDEHGDYVTSTHNGAVHPFNIADREGFRAHLAADTGKLYVGKPVVTRMFGTQLIPLTRRINKADGSFGGMVSLLIEPRRFTEFYENAVIGRNDMLVLVGLDGVTRARQQGSRLTSGEVYTSSKLIHEGQGHGAGTIIGPGQRDKVRRLYSFRRLDGFPLLAVIGSTEDGALAKFEQRRLRYFWGAGVVSLMIVLFATLLYRANRRQAGAVAQLVRLAHFDTLTGLPNRRLFYESLGNTLTQARENDWVIAVLFIDLDRFKNINDTLGHALGDELLRQFGSRLFHCLRSRDTVGRLGGDEFTVLLVLPKGHQGAVTVANKIRDALRKPFDLNGHEINVTASIGITFFPDDGIDADTLLKYADTAMYRAKEAGRDTYRFFTAAMNVQAMAKLDLEHALRKALENEEFVLHYQPKIEIPTGNIVGVEALLRWNRPGHGLVYPGDFIPLLEETGLIARVGSWVIATACKQIAAWERNGLGAVHVSVNVSAMQFFEGQPGIGPAARDRQQRDRRRPAGTGTDGNLADVERRGHHRRARQPEKTGHPHLDRRFRHRLLEPGLPEALPDRHDQDRPCLHPRRHHRSGRCRDRAGDYQYGAQPEAERDRRRRGDRGAAVLPAPSRLQPDPGLLLQQAGACRHAGADHRTREQAGAAGGGQRVRPRQSRGDRDRVKNGPRGRFLLLLRGGDGVTLAGDLLHRVLDGVVGQRIGALAGIDAVDMLLPIDRGGLFGDIASFRYRQIRELAALVGTAEDVQSHKVSFPQMSSKLLFIQTPSERKSCRFDQPVRLIIRRLKSKKPAQDSERA
jgi:diguanylate cyclase (GGDEF)-like protein